jgi:hypothetical protein
VESQGGSVVSLVKLFYSNFKAKNYEQKRRENPKWDFENDTLEKVLRDLRPDVKSILDAPVGTGRFINFYETMLSDASIDGVDLSEDMLSEAKMKVKNKGCEIEFFKKDIINTPFEKSYDFIVCFRFFNLIPWELVKLCLTNFSDTDARYILFPIRLVDENFTGDTYIENKIYLHQYSLFESFVGGMGYVIEKDWFYEDDRPGDYKIYLLKKKLN